jgi:hypothetical protein
VCDLSDTIHSHRLPSRSRQSVEILSTSDSKLSRARGKLEFNGKFLLADQRAQLGQLSQHQHRRLDRRVYSIGEAQFDKRWSHIA